MKFGYFANLTNWDHRPYTQVLDETREIAQYCDSTEWDSIWLTEHHLNHEGMDACPNPLMICADLAARTKKNQARSSCKHHYIQKSTSLC